MTLGRLSVRWVGFKFAGWYGRVGRSHIPPGRSLEPSEVWRGRLVAPLEIMWRFRP